MVIYNTRSLVKIFSIQKNAPGILRYYSTWSIKKVQSNVFSEPKTIKIAYISNVNYLFFLSLHFAFYVNRVNRRRYSMIKCVL